MTSPCDVTGMMIFKGDHPQIAELFRYLKLVNCENSARYYFIYIFRDSNDFAKQLVTISIHCVSEEKNPCPGMSKYIFRYTSGIHYIYIDMYVQV